MVCHGGPWRVRSYAVEDAVEGFAAGGSTACHSMYVVKKDNIAHT